MRTGRGENRTPLIDVQRGEPYRADLRHWTMQEDYAGAARNQGSAFGQERNHRAGLDEV